MVDSDLKKVVAKLTARAWANPDIYAQLLTNPKPLLAECGVTGDGLKIRFIEKASMEETAGVYVLTAKPQGVTTESLNLQNDAKNLLANYTPQTPSSSSGGRHPAPSMDMRAVFEESSEVFYVGPDSAGKAKNTSAENMIN